VNNTYTLELLGSIDQPVGQPVVSARIDPPSIEREPTMTGEVYYDTLINDFAIKI